MTDQLPLSCPVCGRPAAPGLPLVDRWAWLLEHVGDVHDLHAEMLAIALRSRAAVGPFRAHSVTRAAAAMQHRSGGGATAAADGFYPRGEAW